LQVLWERDSPGQDLTLPVCLLEEVTGCFIVEGQVKAQQEEEK
jgi:hypothetical protein